MQFDRTGIILYTLEYKKCVKFYKEILGLNVMFVTEDLTCFEFGESYLMVEIADEYGGTEMLSGRIRTCLRMNVQDVKALVDKLTENNVKVDYQEHAWGTVGKFFDPDGNLCAFRDSKTFEEQISDFEK